MVFGESRPYTGRSTDAAAVPMGGTAALGEPMETETNMVPMRIGVSPSGVVWTAYRPEHVEPMRRRLRAAWDRHAAKVAAEAAAEAAEGAEPVMAWRGRVLECKGARYVCVDLHSWGGSVRKLNRHGIPSGGLMSGTWRRDGSGAARVLSVGYGVSFRFDSLGFAIAGGDE